ncbi:MAG: hypothetical protein WD845_00185, partial [Pirellulales bacterium]
MNRNSLFGRLSSTFAAGANASRPESYRTQIEPLEVRQVLSATFYVNDNWQEAGALHPGTLEMGDTVVSSADPVNSAITAIYGFTAFGKVTSIVTGAQFLTQGSDPFGGTVPFDMQYIYSAIQKAANNNFDVVSIIEGTYTESDIVVNKSQLILTGSGVLNTPGSTGPYVSGSDTLIVPEVASTKAEQEFPVGSHSGIIVYASDVEVKDVRLDGSGGGAGTFNYHHGVTTLYEAQGGVDGVGGTDYASTRAGNLELTRRQNVSVSVGTTTVNATAHLYSTGDNIFFYSNNNTDGTVAGGDGIAVALRVPSPLVENTQYFVRVIDANSYSVHPTASDATNNTNAITFTTAGFSTITTLNNNVYGGIVEGTGSTRPQLQFHHVTVNNAWYHGLSMSGPAGMQFDEDNGDGSGRPDNEVYNAVVNNVGDPGNQGVNHVGILIQNVDSYRSGDPGGAPASVGGNAWQNIVNNAGVGIKGNAYGAREWNNDNQARNDSTYSFNTVNNPKVSAYHLEFVSGTEFIANTATFTNGVGIGIHTIQGDGSFLGNVIGTPGSAPLIGMKIENSNTTGVFAGGTANSTLGNTRFQGPGTGVGGSVGILADNSFGANANSNFLATYGTVVTGFAIGVNSKQSLASTVPNTVLVDRMNVTGNAIGFQFGPNAVGGNVQVGGQLNIPQSGTNPFTVDPVVTMSGSTMMNGWLPNITEINAHTLQAQPVPPVMTDNMLKVTGASGTLVTVAAAYSYANFIGVRIRRDDTVPGFAMPANMVDNQRYWIRSTSATTFQIHNSQADAMSNTNPVSGLDFSVAVGPITITELVPPGFPGVNQPQYVITDAATIRPDESPVGNLTLGSGSTYTPALGGDASTSIATIQDFNNSQSWGLLDVSDLDHVNPWGGGFKAKARLGFWGSGSVVQNGTSDTLRVADVIFGTGNQETGGAYQLTTTPVDVTEMGYLRVIAKLGLGTTTADEFLVSVVDIDGTSDLHYFPTALMNSTTYTTFYSNLLTPSVRFVEGDNVLNMSQISGWAVSGAFGSTDGVAGTDRMSLVVDDISYTPAPRASSYKVTGTVDLSGAILEPVNVGVNLYASSIGQTFTIINNDDVDAITGTFAGKPEGFSFNIGSDIYQITYVGGTDSNDVVLTQTGVVPTNSLVEGRHIFYNQSTFDGNSAAINASDNN